MLHSTLCTDKGADDYNVGIAISSSILVESLQDGKKEKKQRRRKRKREKEKKRKREKEKSRREGGGMI